MSKIRADQLLMERGLARSRAEARDLILRGAVTAEGQPVKKPATGLYPESQLDVRSSGYVSRGGDKLEGALADLNVGLQGRVCVDIGASTGGFTDCALRHHALRVYAVDVGREQLAARLREDARVTVMDGTNARRLSAADFDAKVEVVLVDASFISLRQLAPAICAILAPGGEAVILIKPQFEAGRAAVQRSRGVVRDAAVRHQALDAARAALSESGLEIVAEADCRLPGPKGNLERFVYARKR